MSGVRKSIAISFFSAWAICSLKPGGRIRHTLKAGVTGNAVFGGSNEEYRYRLSRTWDAKKPFALFVLMNPSTADPVR